MSDWTAADLPSFSGRTVVVTGANSGLGLVTARELARVGAKVIVAVRNLDKGNAAAAGMTGDVEVRRLDLQNLASVREFADGVDGADVLVNNAGIMAVPYAQTVDGFESQIGTNHLGHFALTNLLLPKITDRVVTVSSMMHLLGSISLKDLNWKSRPYLGLAGLLPVQAREPAVHQRATAPPRRRRVADTRAGRAPRLLRHQPAGRIRRGSLASSSRPGTASWPPTPTSAPARRSTRCHRTCPATVSRPPLRDARPHRPGGTQPAGPQREDRGGAVGAVRAVHRHQISALRLLIALPSHGVTARVVTTTVIDGNLVQLRPWPCPRTTTGTQEQILMAKTSAPTTNNLTALVRTETGKGASRRARREGKIPAVLYGHGADPQHLELPAHEFAAVLRHHVDLAPLRVFGRIPRLT